jgi:predicted membrane GTPase involved in stress response
MIPSLGKKEGKFVTLDIRERLTKELEKNLAMKLVKLILLINLMVLVVVY